VEGTTYSAQDEMGPQNQTGTLMLMCISVTFIIFMK